LKIEAAFVRSAASARDLPRDGLAEIALVGRSNVGKSSLINALVRQKIARTSATPGKTRLANIYRVARGASPPLYLVDLPGYGYARGRDSAAEFEVVAEAYFGPHERSGSDTAALLVVDMRHPGLSNDLQAWSWIRSITDRAAVVGTKADKLARGERIRAWRALESVFDVPVLPVSAASGEGLDQLWTLIDRLASRPSSSRPHTPRPPAAADSPPKKAPTRSSGWTSPRSKT
jgi:GTP-binding protein